MCPRPKWMTRNDGPIVEFLADSGLALPPRAIEYNLRTRRGLEIPYSTINHRLGILVENGMVTKEYEKGGFYAITEKGRAYLAGELDADDQK